MDDLSLTSDRKLLDTLFVGVIVQHANGVLIDLNERACELAGRPREELIGRVPGEVFTLFDDKGIPIPHDRLPYRTMLDERRPVRNLVVGFDRPDETRVWVLLDSMAEYDEDGAIVRAVTTCVDVTELKQAEASLRRREQSDADSQRRLKQLHEVSLLLAQVETADDLCRIAVESIREHFGFDRASIWLLDSSGQRMCGSFGTDEHGNTIDERVRQSSVLPNWQDYDQSSSAIVHADMELYTEDATIVRGELAIAVLRDRERVLGAIYADNFFTSKPIDDSHREVLGLLGLTVGNLLSKLKAAEAVRESEARFHAMFAESAVGMAILDVRGAPIETNAAIREMLGYTAEEMRRQTFREYTHPDDIEHNWQLFDDVASGKRNNYDLEKRYVRKDGAIIWVRVTVSIVRDIAGDPLFFVGIAENITERHEAVAKLRESLDQIQRLSRRLESIREEERGRVAREIHDELGQALTGMKMDLAHFRKQCARSDQAIPPNRVVEKLGETVGVIDATIDAVRRIATELRPAILDTLGLVAALEWLARDFSKRSGIRCTFRAQPETVDLPDDVATSLFRIVQESLTNVWRHAKATRVNVQLQVCDGELSLTVQDNGAGIPANTDSDKLSFGLISMRERAASVGGAFQVRRRKPHGTVVQVKVRSG